MAEGLLRHDAGDRFEVFSAGTKPSQRSARGDRRHAGAGHRHFRPPFQERGRVRRPAIRLRPDRLRQRQGELPDLSWQDRQRSITASKIRPPSQGSEEERLAVFRRVRDELRAYLNYFPEGAQKERKA